MNEYSQDKMTCKCSLGHKLRGSVDLIGKTVRCPRCNDKFVFGYEVRESVSDTAVMRILGEGPAPLPTPKAEMQTRPCKRCGVGISSKTSVCGHCNCYNGLLPDFFAKLGGRSRPSTN